MVMILPKKPKTCASASKMLTEYFKKDIFCAYNTNSFKVIYSAGPDKLRVITSIYCSGVGYISNDEWDDLVRTIQNDGWDESQLCWQCNHCDYREWRLSIKCDNCGKEYNWRTAQ